ncbi:MAG: hypothetical protein OXJ64_19920 [Boseongicola sp.]|nr:hypothetical protein [Boseongicola sp.]
MIATSGGVGYVISLDAARHILEHALPVINVQDWPACAKVFKERKRWRVVHPRLVNHAKHDEDRETSILRQFRRRRKRRFLGIYVPPWNQIVQSYTWKLTYWMRGYRKISW